MSISLYKSIFCGIMVLGEMEFLASPPFLSGRWCQASALTRKRALYRCRSMAGRRALTPETMGRNHLTVPPREGRFFYLSPNRPAPRRVVSGCCVHVVRADVKCPQHAARTKQPNHSGRRVAPSTRISFDCGKTLYRQGRNALGPVKRRGVGRNCWSDGALPTREQE